MRRNTAHTATAGDLTLRTASTAGAYGRLVDRSVAYAVADDGLAFKRVIPTSVVDTFPVIGFRISPNPSHGSVTITIDPSQAPYQATRVTVFDALGRGVHQEW
ncbi:MAG: hypothetical protein SGJ05_01055, partial [bacterium]|nr:hypothetical protein [bacterium]